MRISNTHRLRRHAKILLLCAVACALGILGVSLVSAFRPSAPSVQSAVGFDFSKRMNEEWSGPKAGERLDLASFAGPAGERIADVAAGDVFMLATVDPDCGASAATRDQMRDVRNHIGRAGVPYVLVSVTTSRPPDEFFKFSASLDVDAPAFRWASGDAAPPASLVTMVVPSHILVTRDGTILRTWPGTSQSKKIRFRMVKQIIADTLQLAAE